MFFDPVHPGIKPSSKGRKPPPAVALCPADPPRPALPLEQEHPGLRISCQPERSTPRARFCGLRGLLCVLIHIGENSDRQGSSAPGGGLLTSLAEELPETGAASLPDNKTPQPAFCVH